MKYDHVKELQKKLRVKPDGIIGKKTFEALCEHYSFPDPIVGVHFLAQCDHETGGFKTFEENLNYSAKGLRTVFKKYFPEPIIAQAFARKPKQIANRVYADRMGNGDENSGDGWRFRGRGAIQLTGRSNYEAFAEDFEMPFLLDDLDRFSTDLAFDAAAWFFWKNNIFDLCINTDKKTVKEITKKINGGYNGLDHRIKLTSKYEKLL